LVAVFTLFSKISLQKVRITLDSWRLDIKMKMRGQGMQHVGCSSSSSSSSSNINDGDENSKLQYN
jgi:hypothetical protein